MMSHEVTMAYSGWRNQTVSENAGEREYSTPQNHHTELFVEAECSCGETFVSESEMQDHLDEVIA